jgi:hypothetical protein
MKKIPTFVTITLLVIITLFPLIHAQKSTNTHEDKLIDITISQYTQNGNIEKSIIQVSKKDACYFSQELINSQDLNQCFSICKKYGLISENITKQHLRYQMLDFAQKFDFSNEKLKSFCNKINNQRNGENRWIAANYLNSIEGMFVFNYNLPLGLSMFTGTPNLALYTMGEGLIPSVDLLYGAISPLGIYEFLEGELPDFHLLSVGAFILVGFVGYVASSPLFGVAGYMFGYAIASLVVGNIQMGPLPNI